MGGCEGVSVCVCVCVCVRVNCQEQSLEEEMIALLEKRKHVKAQRCAAEGGGGGGGRQGQGPEKAREQLEAQSQDQPGTQDQFDTRSSSEREREREREREGERERESSVGPWLLRDFRVPHLWLHFDSQQDSGRSSGKDIRDGAAEDRWVKGGNETEVGGGCRGQLHEARCSVGLVGSEDTKDCSTFSMCSSLPLVSPCSSPTLSIRVVGCLTDDNALMALTGGSGPATTPHETLREWKF